MEKKLKEIEAKIDKLERRIDELKQALIDFMPVEGEFERQSLKDRLRSI